MNILSQHHVVKFYLMPLVNIFLSAYVLAAPRFEGGTKEVPLSTEREVKVNLNAGLATVYISAGSSNQLLEADVEEISSEALKKCMIYNLRDNIGYLNIDTECDEGLKADQKKKKVHFSGWESRTWNLQFTDAVPLSFDIDLGLGKGVLDFTGLSVKNLNLSTGASSVTLKFDKPNKSVIEDLNIETGLSKFVARGLCNANFRHMRFEGGVGGYTLDFSGTLDTEVDVDLEVGLGSLTVIIPHHIGVKIFYEQNFMSQIDLDNDFEEREEDVYYSSNYEDARGKMNIHIEAGLGGVKIKRE